MSPRKSQVEALLAEHIADDRVRFESIQTSLADLKSDTTSLLASRSYVRGAWKGIVIVAGVVSSAIALIIAWFK